MTNLPNIPYKKARANLARTFKLEFSNTVKESFRYRCKYHTFQFYKSGWNWNTN